MKKVLLFQQYCPNWHKDTKKLGTKIQRNSFLFYWCSFIGLRLIFTGRYIRNGCFFDSLFFYIWVIIKWCSAAATISTNLFLALEMTPNRANTISKHGQMLWRSLSEDLCNSRKLKKVVAIYKTNKLVLSKK